jgi:hypothetical protein
MSADIDVEQERVSVPRDTARGPLWTAPVWLSDGLDSVILGYD